MRKKSEKTKERLKMGKGEGKDYKPGIQVGEFSSRGTVSICPDWITGRSVHLMSQLETEAWYILRFDDDNIDIREQYLLDKEITSKIAFKKGIIHPHDKNGELLSLSTDFLVTRSDGSMVAVSVKPNKEDLNQRTLEKLYIEAIYWDLKNVEYHLIDRKDIDHKTAINIRDIVAFYNCDYFVDDIQFLKFLMAHKYIKTDLSKELDYREMIETKEFKQWKEYALNAKLVN